MSGPKKPRTRHVASDEAHAWARSLALNNPNAKTVLRALALYVNGEGSCFVGIDQLSEDTDLSPDTVRRRLVWLEQIGAIVRLPQWLDGNGRRNSDARGKRTSDEIRMLLAADIDEIERRAKGGGDSENSSTETTEISPSTGQGLESGPETVSPRLAPRQPSQSCDHLISEPEPEDSPLSPPPGECVIEDERRVGQWRRFLAVYPGIASMDQHSAQTELAKLPIDEAERAISSAAPYAEECRKLRKPPRNAHLWLRKGMFRNFESAAARNGSYPFDSRAALAITALYEIGGASDAFRKINRRSDGSVSYRQPVTPRLLALADAPPRADWLPLTRQQSAAWESMLRDAITVQVRRHLTEGDPAPWPWPPSIDGKIYTDTTGPPESLMTESDWTNIK